jgi:hypothetical protein
MSNPDAVVLPGMRDYAKVQSFELRAFDRKTESSPRGEPTVQPTTIITEIKKDIQKPETDRFPIQTLQMSPDLTELALNSCQDDNDENSTESSE